MVTESDIFVITFLDVGHCCGSIVGGVGRGSILSYSFDGPFQRSRVCHQKLHSPTWGLHKWGQMYFEFFHSLEINEQNSLFT